MTAPTIEVKSNSEYGISYEQNRRAILHNNFTFLINI